MKAISKKVMVLILAIVMIMGSLCAAPVVLAESTAEEVQWFSNDGVSQELSYDNAGNGYIFVADSADIPNITLSLSGIASASQGILNEDKTLLTGAFTNNGDSVTLLDENGNVCLVVTVTTIAAEQNPGATVTDSQSGKEETSQELSHENTDNSYTISANGADSVLVKSAAIQVQWCSGDGVSQELFYDHTGSGYIFAANSADIPNITLSLSGIASASQGTFNEDKTLLTGAFANSGDSVTLTGEDGSNYLVIATAVAEQSFGATVTDPQGCEIDDWKDEDSGKYDLFLTNKVSIPDLSVVLTGGVVSSSSGSVDIASGTLTGAFSQSGDSVTLTDYLGNRYELVVMQSTLPSVYIDLNGTTLETIHQDKNVKYPGNTVVISDVNGVYDDFSDSTAEIKGRGNTSWTYYDKKGYQIKFDKKQSILGMEKAKKWILIANAGDETLMHNMLAFQLAKSIDMDYVTDYQYVDLWIDGEYRGNYILGEKIEIGSGRVDLSDSSATILEQDEVFYAAETYNFYNEWLGKHFVIKETNADDTNAEEMQSVMDSFQNRLNQLEALLQESNIKNLTLEELGKFMDIDSAAKYYLVNEYLCNYENTVSSFYWYMDGANDVLHLGPVWDFDFSMESDYRWEYYQNNHTLFNQLMSCSAFYDYITQLYNQYKSAFSGLSDTSESYLQEIDSSQTMNFTRWNIWGTTNPKGNVFCNSYSECYQKMVSWLKNRAATFQLQKGNTHTTAHIVDDLYLDVTLYDYENTNNVCFAIWGEENNQNDLIWYEAIRQADGTWYSRVDLSDHGELGLYQIHVYGTVNDKRNLLSNNILYVNKIATPDVHATVSDHNSTLHLVLTGAQQYTDVLFPVWGEVNGQNDLVWYRGSKQSDGSWTCDVPLGSHGELGQYLVHVYGTSSQTTSGSTTSDSSKSPKTGSDNTGIYVAIGIGGAAVIAAGVAFVLLLKKRA